MSKFDYFPFTDNGGFSDTELVFHAKKYTKEEALAIYADEYRDFKPAKKEDIKERAVRYYVKPPENVEWDGKGGIYSYCNKGQKGSFPVLVIPIRKKEVE